MNMAQQNEKDNKGAPENRILVGVIRTVFARNLQYRRDWGCVCIKDVANLGDFISSLITLIKFYHFCYVLVDKDDGNVRSLHEILHSILNVLERCVLVHHQEVGLPVLVELPDPAEEEAHTGVLVPDNPDQLSASSV